MKKVCLLSGAVINSGDFLIEKRSLELIKHFLPDSEIKICNRAKEDYSNRIDELNSFDVIIISGGPLYQPGLYGNGIPFINPDKINELKTPVFFVGGGLHDNFYSCCYSSNDKIFYDKGVHGEKSMGCRDIFTLNFLKHEGYPAVLTGCPAWYDLDYINRTELKIKRIEDIRRICVSDPADKFNVPMLLDLIEHLRKTFPDAFIRLVNHREPKQELLSKQQYLKNKLGVDIIDISGSADGFSVYDDSDMHVGFRVHAHIYNLSHRNFSILYNEDIRGIGVNTTLGLDNLNIEMPSFGKRKIFGCYYLIKFHSGKSYNSGTAGWMFDDYLKSTFESNFQKYNNAFEKMKVSFNNMKDFFGLIQKV